MTAPVNTAFRTKGVNGAVRDMAFSSDGQTIFAVGAFSLFNGATRQSVVRLDALTGANSAWVIPTGGIIVGSPTAAHPNVMTCWTLVVTATRLFVGCGRTPNYAAAFRLDNGNSGDRAWLYSTSGNIQTVALSADGLSLYVGGHFGTNGLNQTVSCPGGTKYLEEPGDPAQHHRFVDPVGGLQLRAAVLGPSPNGGVWEIKSRRPRSGRAACSVPSTASATGASPGSRCRDRGREAMSDHMTSTETERPRQADATSFGIVTPTLNAEKYLDQTLKSIWSQTSDRVNIDHVLVDGGSTDGTVDVAAGYPTRVVVATDDQGMYDAVNRGLAMVSGDIVGYVNADDEIGPGALALVAQAFRAHPEAQWLMGTREFIDGDGTAFAWMTPVHFTLREYVGLGWSCVHRRRCGCGEALREGRTLRHHVQEHG